MECAPRGVPSQTAVVHSGPSRVPTSDDGSGRWTPDGEHGGARRGDTPRVSARIPAIRSKAHPCAGTYVLGYLPTRSYRGLFEELQSTFSVCIFHNSLAGILQEWIQRDKGPAGPSLSLSNPLFTLFALSKARRETHKQKPLNCFPSVKDTLRCSTTFDRLALRRSNSIMAPRVRNKNEGRNRTVCGKGIRGCARERVWACSCVTTYMSRGSKMGGEGIRDAVIKARMSRRPTATYAVVIITKRRFSRRRLPRKTVNRLTFIASADNAVIIVPVD